MNIKQNTLAALLVLGIGMGGCNDNNSTSQTVENKTATILGNIGSQHSNGSSDITIAQLREITPALSNIIASNLNSYRSYIEHPLSNFSTPATIAQVQIMLDTVNTSKSVLGSIGNQHSNGSSDITCLLYTSPSPRDISLSRMPSSA